MSDDTFRWVIAGAVGISTLCILIMAFAALAIYRVVSKVQTHVVEMADKVNPLIGTVRRLAEENGPKISAMATDTQVIAANAKDISEVAKEQAHRFAELGRDFADRTKAQIARVDAAVDQTVDHVQNAGENLKESVLKPVREANASARLAAEGGMVTAAMRRGAG